MAVQAPVFMKPWTTPNFAVIEGGDGGNDDMPTSGIPIKELPAKTLDEMAREWLDHLYAKVERPNPFAWQAKR